MVLELGEAHTGLISPQGLRFIHEASKMPLVFPNTYPPQPDIEVGYTPPIEHIAHAKFDASRNQPNDPNPERDFTRVPPTERPHFQAKQRDDTVKPYFEHSPKHDGAKYSQKELKRMEE